MFDASNGNCVTQRIPVEVFFPEANNISPKEFRQKELEAKAICNNCPVAFQCLQAALSENEYGIWGGTTMEERRSMRKGIRRKQVNYRAK